MESWKSELDEVILAIAAAHSNSGGGAGGGGGDDDEANAAEAKRKALRRKASGLEVTSHSGPVEARRAQERLDAITAALGPGAGSE